MPKAISRWGPCQSVGNFWLCAMQAEQSDKATLQRQLREAQSMAAQAAAAAPVAAQQQQQLAEQTAAVAKLRQQLTEAQVTGSMQQCQSAHIFAAAHLLIEAATVAGHCYAESDRVQVFTGRGAALSSETALGLAFELVGFANHRLAGRPQFRAHTGSITLGRLSLSSALAAVASPLHCAGHAAACPEAACSVR